jgi:hypothetical protein
MRDILGPLVGPNSVMLVTPRPASISSACYPLAPKRGALASVRHPSSLTSGRE